MRAPDVEYTPPDAEYATRTEALFYSMPFVRHLGLKIAGIGPGWLDCQLHNRPELQQQNGFLHAGVIATLADMSAGIASATLVEKDKDTLSAEFKIVLLRPGIGDRFIARGRTIKHGRKLSIAESWIYGVKSEKETLIARGYLTLAIM